MKGSFFLPNMSFLTKSSKINKQNILPEIKLNKNDFAQLDDIGIKEMQLCKDSTAFKSFLRPLSLYTSLDYSCIESSIVLSTDSPHTTIYPLPYMSNTNITSKELLKSYKSKFGLLKSGNKTNTNKYWKDKKLDSEFLNIQTSSATIDWSNIDEKNRSSLSSYNFRKFIEKVEHLCLAQYEEFSNIYFYMGTFIFVCDYNVILDILTHIKGVRFNKRNNIIERSSIWEVVCDLEFKINSMDKISKKSMKFKNFNKLYPIEFDYSPLRYELNNNSKNTYTYLLNSQKYQLFDGSKTIPVKFLKKLTFLKLKSNHRKIAQSIINLNNKKKKIHEESNNSNKLSILKKNNNNKNVFISFETLK